MDQQRDRITNPTFPPSSQHSPSYASYQSPTPQPPPQQPPFDPFARPDQRRDPFLPASFGGRRDSLNGSSHQPSTLTSKDVFQPSAQPPPPPFRSNTSNSYSAERRDSLGDSNTSQSLQSSTSLLNRYMPPPSSSPKHSPAEPYSNSILRGPLPSPISKPRDSSASISNHRSGGAMSIQSMMGSDSGPSANPPSWANASSRRASGSSTHPPSPLDRTFGSRGDAEADAHPRTPARRPEGMQYSSFDRPEVSATSPTAAGSQYPVSERTSHGLSHLLQPFQHTPAKHNGPPSRPYSQPDGVEPRSGPPGPVHYDKAQSREDYGGGTFEKAVRDRSYSDLDSRKSSIPNQHYPRPGHEHSSLSGPPQPIHAPYQPRPQEYRDPLPNDKSGRQDVDSNHGAPHGSNGPYARRSPQVNGGADSTSFDGVGRQPGEQPGSSNQSYYPYSQSPSVQSPAITSARYPGTNTKTPPLESQPRLQAWKSIEDSRRHSLSRFANELERRPDRSSPLPQAVQGAQGQPAGSGRDPGIKSEFGRMFSGLGSGVGSTPQPLPPLTNGISTPTRKSPEDEAAAAAAASAAAAAEAEASTRRNVSETTGLPRSGPGSRGGRRGGKRAQVENSKRDSDSGGDGRATPMATLTRGTKRNRYMQQATGHHHHHHPQGPHHHHHHRKADEGGPVPLNTRPGVTTNNSFKFPTPGPAPNGTAGLHHHHHHHANSNAVPHHHHHPVKAAVDTRVKRRTTIISTSPLLRSVAHVPRRHLGSQLYSPTVTIPSASYSTMDAPSIYQTATEPNLLPHFDQSKVNSTFTIRVPRFYLTDTEREKTCKARRVWGTDVYTDDSDPLAAAFHAGWIRGAWGPDVDVSIVLDLPAGSKPNANPQPNGNTDGTSSPEMSKNSKSSNPNGVANSSNDAVETMTAPPTDGPPIPPPDRDLHLTLLLLPPLEKYTGSVWHGVRSRSWGGNHDGLSFKIEKVEWVEEAVGSRWEERGVAAKKRRIAGPLDNVSTKKTNLGSLGTSRLIGTVHTGRTSTVTA